MARFNIFIEKTFKFFSSIQLAIFILLSLGIMSATGTILESRYDTAYAQKVIYQSPYMYFILALLCVNLINVMIDRWPWKRHHAGFILAHVGIVMIVVGALITRLYGVDGSMPFDIGEKGRYVTISDTELAIYGTFGEGPFRVLYSTDRDFFSKRPSEKKPFKIEANGETFLVKDYINFALRDSKIVESSDPKAGPAIRVQLQNDRVNETHWLLRSRDQGSTEINLGPAKIIFADPRTTFEAPAGNYIVIYNHNDNDLTYEIRTARQPGVTKKGRLPLAEAIPTGWMGLQLRLFKYLPRAEEKTEFVKRDRPTGRTQPALMVSYKGKDYWLGLNSNLRVFGDDVGYVVTYRNKFVDLNFDLVLKDFKVGHYQGTRQAMSYASTVITPDNRTVEISMNEPLKYGGYTFYQASFQEDPATGMATTSILSVNKDPGRPMKYIGSLILVLGTIIMFYFKHYRMKIFGNMAKEKE